MASWRFTALALLLVGVQSVLCIDDKDPKCNVTKATTCYWSQAKVHGVDILVPKESAEKYPEDVCRSEQELPVASVCEDYYGACEEPEKIIFKDKENGYALLRTLLLNKTICKDVELLAGCIDRNVMGNCSARFADGYSLLNAEANEKAAKNLSHCLELALKPCEDIVHDVRSGYMKQLAAAVNNMYKVPEDPVPTTPTAPTTTEASTPVTSDATTPTTHEPVTSTTHEPVTSTTHEPVTSTTQEPVTNATGVPPTTPAPPSGASTAKTAGAFGVVALAWLVRAA